MGKVPLFDTPLPHTPVDMYEVNGANIWVKREDLIAKAPYPPNSKLRGVRPLLERLASEYITNIGVFDTRISEASWMVALEGKRLGMNVQAYYARSKYVPRAAVHVLKAGGELWFVRHNFTPICYAEASARAKSLNQYMLPFGLSSHEAVEAVKDEVVYTFSNSSVRYNSVVVCAGSCTILSGIIKATHSLGITPTIYSVSSGASKTTQRRKIIKYIGYIPENVKLCPMVVDYYAPEKREAPFSSNPYYDRKVWFWLEQNIDVLEKPVLFWNIGGW